LIPASLIALAQTRRLFLRRGLSLGALAVLDLIRSRCRLWTGEAFFLAGPKP